MRNLEIVAVILFVFLGLGIAMGMLMVWALGRWQGGNPPGRFYDKDDLSHPEDDNARPPRWPGDRS
jgi:hypothetical protein